MTAAIAATAGVCVLPAMAMDDPSKGLTVLASHAPGGGYDAYARIYARHVGKHIPGLTTVTVKNMPGAAGVVMANFMATQGPPDGSTIALGPGSMATASLFKPKSARYDSREFVWIGSINSDVSVAVARSDSGVKTIDDVFTKELIVGGAGPSDNSVVYANILNNMMGAKLKLVSGYNGSSANVLALERGEVQGIAGWNYSSVTSMRPTWIKEGRIHVLAQMSLERHTDLPNVPTILEIAKSDEQREVLKLIFTQSLIGRVLFAPPKLSANATGVHRKAFDGVIADKEFLAEADKLRLEVNGPIPGARVQEIVGGLFRASPERIKQAAAALGES
ncbi:MAG: Bug family tripartite tricarboxylate transporter substrate binding protein [Beijerinckiaceae bacterium]